MPKQVIPIRRNSVPPYEEVADLEFDLWLATAFRGGSPEEALLSAVRRLRRKTTAGLFFVPKHKSNLHPFPATILSQSGVST